MATFKCNGIDKLIKRFEDMGQVTEKCKERIVTQGAAVILNQQKNDAPISTEDNEDGIHAKDYLDVVDERSGEGYLFQDVGINSKNWEKTKGLYFQNYNGQKSSGKHILWMEKSFKISQVKAKKIIKDELIKELNL